MKQKNKITMAMWKVEYLNRVKCGVTGALKIKRVGAYRLQATLQVKSQRIIIAVRNLRSLPSHDKGMCCYTSIIRVETCEILTARRMGHLSRLRIVLAITA